MEADKELSNGRQESRPEEGGEEARFQAPAEERQEVSLRRIFRSDGSESREVRAPVLFWSLSPVQLIQLSRYCKHLLRHILPFQQSPAFIKDMNGTMN